MTKYSISLSVKNYRFEKIRLTIQEVILLSIMYIFFIPIIILNINAGVLITVLLFLVVTQFGLWLCNKTIVHLADPNLKILRILWISKLIITFILLFAGWIPQLDPSSNSWGYDPQRFYLDAWELVQNDWVPFNASNYQGIIYYYGVIFYVFGHNPVVSALINTLVTLSSTLFLICYSYKLFADRKNENWFLAFILVIPEMLWYDVMTSRETLMAACIYIGTFSIGDYFCKNKGGFKKFLIFLLSLLLILFVRTSMVISLVISIILMIVLLNKNSQKNIFTRIIFLLISIAGLLSGRLVQDIAGGDGVDLGEAVGSLKSFDLNIASNENSEWSSNSIGLLLVPNSYLQALIYLPARMVLYLAAPLPNFSVSVDNLLAGSWQAWQSLMVIPTSIIILLGFPFVILGTIKAWHVRKYCQEALIPFITLWSVIVVVVGGNLIIHERYRIMFTPLLFFTMWFGYASSSMNDKKQWMIRWYGFLIFCIILYYGYKFFN